MLPGPSDFLTPKAWASILDALCETSGNRRAKQPMHTRSFGFGSFEDCPAVMSSTSIPCVVQSRTNGNNGVGVSP